MRLRTNELCPIHRSLSCCGRELLSKPKLVRLGVQRVDDPHHPRGYRELRSPAEMRKLLNRKIRLQAGICAICHEAFTDYNDIPTSRIQRSSSSVGDPPIRWGMLRRETSSVSSARVACKSCSGICERLLVPQRQHGIDSHCSSCWNEAGYERHSNQQDRHSHHRGRI